MVRSGGLCVFFCVFCSSLLSLADLFDLIDEIAQGSYGHVFNVSCVLVGPLRRRLSFPSLVAPLFFPFPLSRPSPQFDD